MKIKSTKLLQSFRRAGKCEYCGKWCKRRQVHHLRTRNPQIDVRINLMALGKDIRDCLCHYEIHNTAGAKGAEKCVEIVAKREGCSVEDLAAVMDLLWRAPKWAGKEWFVVESADWTDSAKSLLVRTLIEAKV